MNTEQLLYPRWKVMSSYPGSLVKEGDIITIHPEAAMVTSGEVKGGPVYQYNKHIFDMVGDYPKIFQRLNWWEGLPMDQMPLYLKLVVDGAEYEYTEVNYDALPKWIEMLFFTNTRFMQDILQPATWEEYDGWKKSKISAK